MNFSLDKLYKYCEQHSEDQSDLLHRLERETHLKTLAPQMLSGHLQGKFLSFISHLLKPENILEIGTFTGYAAICLAQGLTANGQLDTIEANEELETIIRKYIKEANLEDKINLHIADARKLIPAIKKTYDLIFIDAGKVDYSDYFDLVIDKLRVGGLIIADNVLWSGKVLLKEKDRDTQAIHDFNMKIKEDARVENLILPIRDGLMLIRKIDQ